MELVVNKIYKVIENQNLYPFNITATNGDIIRVTDISDETADLEYNSTDGKWYYNNTTSTMSYMDRTSIVLKRNSEFPAPDLTISIKSFSVLQSLTVTDGIVEAEPTDPIITEPIIYTGLNHNLGNSVYGVYNLKEGFTEAFSYSCDNGSTVINHNAITKIKINGLKPEFTDLTLSLEIFTYNIILQKDVSGKVKLFIKQWITLTENREYDIYTETGFNSDNVRFQTTIFYHRYGTEKFPTPTSKSLSNCLIEFYDGRLLLTHYSDPSPGGSEDLKVINIVNDVTIYGIEADYIISDSFDTGVENILAQLDEEVEDAKQDIKDIQDDIIDMKEELDNKFNSFTQVYVSR